MDRIDAMRAFITVVTEGSFTLAAERLALSPQLVSKHIAQLEKHLGARLLNRTTRKLSLTDEGQVAFERWRQILEDLDEVDSDMAQRRGRPTGTLRLTAPAPDGGLMVALAFAPEGVASAPAAVMIPAGELSASIAVRGDAAGVTTVPSAATKNRFAVANSATCPSGSRITALSKPADFASRKARATLG